MILCRLRPPETGGRLRRRTTQHTTEGKTHMRARTNVAGFLLAVTLAACGGGDGTTAGGNDEGSGESLTLGAMFAQTGDAAIFGESQINGVRLAVEEINGDGGVDGAQIDLLVEDTGSQNEQAINILQRFINQDQVDVVVGPTLSAEGKAVAPIANSAQVPIIGASWAAPTGTTDVGPYVWRVALTDGQNIPKAVEAAVERDGYETAALLFGSDDPFTQAGGEAFESAAQDTGIELVATETFAAGDRDFSSQLTKIAAANPDALFVSATGESTASIVEQARQAGIAVPIVGGNGFNTPTVPENAGDAANGVIVAAAWDASSGADNPTNAAFIEAYTAEYNKAPDQFAAQAYSAVYVIAEAARLGGGTGREQILDGLKQVENVDTPLGDFNFTEGRDADAEPVILEIQNGEYIRFES